MRPVCTVSTHTHFISLTPTWWHVFSSYFFSRYNQNSPLSQKSFLKIFYIFLCLRKQLVVYVNISPDGLCGHLKNKPTNKQKPWCPWESQDAVQSASHSVHLNTPFSSHLSPSCLCALTDEDRGLVQQWELLKPCCGFQSLLSHCAAGQR